MGNDEEKGYTVKDKRHFFDKGTEGKKPAKEKKEEPSAPKEEKRESYPPLPPVDFSTFIFSLNTSALLHLGEIADPATGKKEKQIVLAKHTIDVIAMLYEKTKGNLTRDEEALIEHILYDLRMRYIRES